MLGLPRRTRRRFTLLLGILALAAGLWLLLRGGLDRADKVASVGALLIALATFALTFIAPLNRNRSAASNENEQKLINLLAATVANQWSEEERFRRLHDPEPIPIQWHGLGPPISDHWNNIRTDGANSRLKVDGKIADVAEVFEQVLHRRRLVVLGEAGAGKTVLATRLLLGLLERRTDKDPVPVIAPMATWDPNEDSFGEWLSERIAADYPVMQDLRKTRELVAAGQILPILDGFDEMASHCRSVAIEAINRMGVHQPIVITSRRGEYIESIAQGDVVTAAAVIEIEALSTVTVRSYLTRVTPPIRLPHWSKVFSRLEKNPRGRLAKAFSTPLMVSLARESYSVGAANPSDLLDPGLRTKEDIEKHLLHALIPSVFDGAHSTKWGSAKNANEWLGFLARWLRKKESQEIRWWELDGEVEGFVSAAWMLAVALTFTFAWLASGLPLAVVSAIAALGSSLVYLRRIDGRPSIVSISLRRFWKPFYRSVGVCTAIGLVNFAGVGMPEIIVGGFALGVAVGTIVGVMDVMTAQVDTAKPASPAAILRASRSVALTTTLLVGILVGSTLTLAGGNTGGIYGFLSGFLSGSTSIIMSPWGKFLVARLVFSAKGSLPLHLISFLEFSHERGILRQSGPQYQFRHILLQESLAPPKPRRKLVTPVTLPPVEYDKRKVRVTIAILGTILILPACAVSITGSKILLPDVPEITRVVTAPVLLGLCPTYLIAQIILFRNRFRISTFRALMPLVFFGTFAWIMYRMASSELGSGWAKAIVGGQVLGTLLVGKACWARRPKLAVGTSGSKISAKTVPTPTSSHTSS
ncbi:NACHT domain-containing protein [Salinispora arenicola]|uniref:NACHT domain-containing protein n=1 Tax=Salinispora arenicola TaxID=168697 RepID=UPI0009B7DFF1|nr:NACHT domain-containing protein [Salinispora arenicola]